MSEEESSHNTGPAGYRRRPLGPIPELAQALRSPVLDKVALAGAIALLVLIGVRSAYQWDFAMFLDSAREYSLGGNPYKGAGLSFFHPPITLYLYGLFTHMPLGFAKTLWLGLHLVASAILFVLWNRHFVALEIRWPTIAFLVLGHNAAIYGDFVAGNVSSFEQLGIWTAFTCLLLGRYAWFCVLLAISSQFKLTPILFSVLVLILPQRPRWGWFFASLGAFAGIFMLNRVMDLQMWDLFWSSAQQLDERHGDNAAVLPFIRDAVDILGTGTSARTYFDELAYLAVAAFFGIVSLHWVLKYRRHALQFDHVIVICFACVVYALVLPRFKTYSAILLLAPTLYLVRSQWRTTVLPIGVVIVAALALFPHGSTPLPVKKGFVLFIEYIPLFARVAIWGGYLMLMRQQCLNGFQMAGGQVNSPARA